VAALKEFLGVDRGNAAAAALVYGSADEGDSQALVSLVSSAKTIAELPLTSNWIGTWQTKDGQMANSGRILRVSC